MSIIDRVCGKLGLVDSNDNDITDNDMPMGEENIAAKSRAEVMEELDAKFRKTAVPNNVVSFHTSVNNAAGSATAGAAKPVKVMVVEPLSFDDSQYIADHLKNHKPVVVNFENTEEDVTRRIIDFVSGTTYALSGNIQKVGHSIFLCTPKNVEVSYNSIENFDESPAMPWQEGGKKFV